MTTHGADGPESIADGDPAGATAPGQVPGTAAEDLRVPDKQIQRWVDDGGAQIPDPQDARG